MERDGNTDALLPPNKTQAGRGGNLEALNPDVGRASTVQAGGNPEAVYSETLAVQRRPRGLSPRRWRCMATVVACLHDDQATNIGAKKKAQSKTTSRQSVADKKPLAK